MSHKILVILLIGNILLCNGASVSKYEAKVVGGQVAADGAFPYQVSIRTLSNFHFCGGSIISDRAVLTAAHCIYTQNAKNIIVVAGTNKLNKGGIVYEADRIKWHDDFDMSEIHYDIGIIIIKKTFSFGDKIGLIGYSKEFVNSGVILKLTGWGTTSFPGAVPNDLQIVQLKSLSNKACSKVYGNRIIDSQICTLNGAGQGACHGDSGGPLVYKDNVIGIVSWGTPCAIGKPDVFTRVSSFIQWIEDELKMNIEN